MMLEQKPFPVDKRFITVVIFFVASQYYLRYIVHDCKGKKSIGNELHEKWSHVIALYGLLAKHYNVQSLSLVNVLIRWPDSLYKRIMFILSINLLLFKNRTGSL